MTEGEAMERPRTRTKVTKVEKVEAPGILSYYANSVDILMSVYDFVLTIGQMRASGDDTVVVEQQARIIMSPQHLKAFARLLVQKVEEYETEVGIIPEVPAVRQQHAAQSSDAVPAALSKRGLRRA